MTKKRTINQIPIWMGTVVKDITGPLDHLAATAKGATGENGEVRAQAADAVSIAFNKIVEIAERRGFDAELRTAVMSTEKAKQAAIGSSFAEKIARKDRIAAARDARGDDMLYISK